MVVARRLPDAALDPALDLVLRARAGDATAFAQLVHAHERGIYNLVLGIVRNREDAGDVVQEVWVRVARYLPELREPERFAPWLYRIARNCSMDFHKAKKCRPQPAARREDDEDDLFDVPDPAADEPERALVSLDERRKVWETLGALSESDRTILFLRDSQEMPYTEIAGVLGISNNAAEVRVFRARERFRKHFLHLEERTGPCNVSPLQLSAYAEGEVGDATRIMLERHVDTCQHCAKRVQTIATGRRLYRGMGLFFVPSSTTFAVFEKVQSLLGSLMSAPAAVGAAGATAATATATAVATSATASTAVAPALVATVTTATVAGSSAGAGLLAQAAGLAATKAAAVIVSTAVIGGVAGYSEEQAMPAQAPQPVAAAVSVPAPVTSADVLAAGSSLGPGLAVVTSRGARTDAAVPGAASMAPPPQAGVTTTAREQQRSAAAPPALTSRKGGGGSGKSDDDGAGSEGHEVIRRSEASPATASAGLPADVAPAAAARADRERESAQERDLERERERQAARAEETRAREVARLADAERAAREARVREDRAPRDVRDAKDERKSDGIGGGRADKDLVGAGADAGKGVNSGVAAGQAGPANIASAVVTNLSSAASTASATAVAANPPSAAPAAGVGSPNAPSALDGASLAAQISSAASSSSAASNANAASIASSVAASVASSVEHSIAIGLAVTESHGRGDRDDDRGSHGGGRGNGDRDDDRGGHGHGR